MGWDFTHGTSKKDIIRELTAETDKRRCLSHSCRGNCLWTVEENKKTGKRVIALYLLGSKKDFGWGYKDMIEAEGPFYYTCPLKYLDMAPVACAAWRSEVRKYHARRRRKFSIGETVKLIAGCSVPEVTITSLKPLLGEYDGRSYRLPRRLMA